MNRWLRIVLYKIFTRSSGSFVCIGNVHFETLKFIHLYFIIKCLCMGTSGWQNFWISIVWFHCLHRLFDSIVWIQCLNPLFDSIVWIHWLIPLFDSIVWCYCLILLFAHSVGICTWMRRSCIALVTQANTPALDCRSRGQGIDPAPGHGSWQNSSYYPKLSSAQHSLKAKSWAKTPFIRSKYTGYIYR